MIRAYLIASTAVWATIAAPATAAVIVYTADLTGAAEAPPNASPGTGTVEVTIDTVTHEMTLKVTFSGLLGTTTASHIHCCTAVPGVGTAGVVTIVPSFPGFPGGVSAGIYEATFDLDDAASYNPSFITAHVDVAGAQAFFLNGLSEGKAYWNIHTNLFPGGEIRGFLVRDIPEPGALGLLGLGLLGVAYARRRRA